MNKTLTKGLFGVIFLLMLALLIYYWPLNYTKEQYNAVTSDLAECQKDAEH